MRRTIYLILCGLFPFTLSAQSNEAPKDVVCDGTFFTHCQQPPKLRMDNMVFADSLTTYLTNNNAFPEIGYIHFRCIITRYGQLMQAAVETSNMNSAVVLQYVRKHPNIWTSGKQNGRDVCAYVRLYVSFENGITTAEVPGN